MPTDWYKPLSLFNFGWRASRREFLVIHLLCYAAILAAVIPFGLIDAGTGTPGVAAMIFGTAFSFLSLAIMVVMIAAGVRRLHDQDKSAWFLLLNLVPLVGWIFALIFIFTPGDEQENRYGPNPRHAPRPTGRDPSAA